MGSRVGPNDVIAAVVIVSQRKVRKDSEWGLFVRFDINLWITCHFAIIVKLNKERIQIKANVGLECADDVDALLSFILLLNTGTLFVFPFTPIIVINGA